MTMDRDTVRRIAELARLELDEEEEERLSGDLEDILRHFEELEGLELEAGGGPEDRGLETRLRPDAPGPDAMSREPRELAPAWRGGFFEVPRLDAMRDEGEGA